MYLGRSIAEAKRAAQQLKAPLYVASAGYGLIGADALVAGYDLTLADDAGKLQKMLAHFRATPGDWWGTLCGQRTIAALLGERCDAVLLAALPSRYLTMVADDLLCCTAEQLDRLRLFTSPAGVAALPPRLASRAMPYDERLESVPGYAGTRADFPQRALLHFINHVERHGLTQADAQVGVRSALASYQERLVVRRRRADDREITHLIQQHWLATSGRSHLLLRLLRDQAMVSCEQGRFSRLWNEVREKFASEVHYGLPTA